ncbi:unnamed protein product [Didymodactylos carnosus]|uniref:Uncharacterized protein n=1 Tax=Didymodactylos carnosus TaxID=1234261 RepID=A0A814TK94_9BILA|nr:unnamed protein product [Didymodactylos carnosus]CAF1162572.1 unnamed protein product [Didymodactylos carnosus]CAF3646131.1 unnamed protein product [Didymodactylos carnosus]CAF3926125.1 unnamed protein product [Didymodactylos carnosus]
MDSTSDALHQPLLSEAVSNVSINGNSVNGNGILNHEEYQPVIPYDHDDVDEQEHVPNDKYDHEKTHDEKNGGWWSSVAKLFKFGNSSKSKVDCLKMNNNERHYEENNNNSQTNDEIDGQAYVRIDETDYVNGSYLANVKSRRSLRDSPTFVA